MHTDKGCHLCPRECGTDRKAGETGFCGMGALPVIARASLHKWEEPCISGKNGSGTVFFCGCNLRCVFCQNRMISDIRPAVISYEEWKAGKKTDMNPETAGISAETASHASVQIEVTPQELAEVFLSLQAAGAENINLVTPTHFADSIGPAVTAARGRGLRIPIVYNCGGYESAETIRALEGIVDVWMPDLKYMSDESAMRYSRAPHYFDTAVAALDEMVRQTGGTIEFSPKNMMKKGVLVRHLVLPGQTGDSKRILRFLHDRYGNSVYISIMSQFTPVCDLTEYPEINRKLDPGEYARIVDFAEKIGITQGYIQEGDTAEESFIPAFDGTGI